MAHFGSQEQLQLLTSVYFGYKPFFFLSSLLLGLCHGNHKCEQRSLIQLGSASVATIMAAFGVIKNAHAGGALASRVV